jgi:hypothetical protein
MQTNIDFTSPGYQGDPVEDHFKGFTRAHMPFWWHFRAVLRPTPAASPYLKRIDGATPSEDEQRDFVALSLLNYAVYTGIAEALDFFQHMQHEMWGLGTCPTSGSLIIPLPTSITGSYSYQQAQQVGAQSSKDWQAFEVLKFWKGAYSSVYRSFNAFCNIICVVVAQQPPLRRHRSGEVWTYGYKETVDLLRRCAAKKLIEILERCNQRLEIRHHLDHCWLIWHSIGPGSFQIDANFQKGYVPIHPGVQVSATVDAHKRTQRDIRGSADDFDLAYQELAVKDGFLDRYLTARGWEIDYSDYGPPHNGRRPLP